MILSLAKKKKDDIDVPGQMSIFDMLQDFDSKGNDLSSNDLTDIITRLQAKQKELAKQEEQRRRETERQEQLRREQEEKKRQEEHVKRVTSMELPLDWENIFDDDEETAGVHVESIGDGLVKCLNRFARVDIEYIAAITGREYAQVIEALRGSIYQNPDTWGECFFKGWETAEEYLSGNIRKKLKSAKENDEIYHGYFSDNVEALENVMPKSLSYDEIYVTLGSPWVPVKYINDFVSDITGRWLDFDRFEHDDKTGMWSFTDEYKRYKFFDYYDYEWKSNYGTRNLKPANMILKTLNMQSVAVYDTKRDADGKNHRILNQKETVIALEKQKKLMDDFKAWIWADPERKRDLENIYAEKFLSNIQRHFDGSFLELPGMNREVTLYQYQKNAIARIIFTPNTLLSHDVGSGKTYIMIVAGMELKRLGLSKKNLYVVPNNIITQWHEIFSLLYPSADVLYVDPKSFVPAKREAVLEDIRDNDHDAVIMAYSCFSMIPVSPDKSTDVCFEELGITRLFVDEAHNFKNVPIEMHMENVMGISATGSKKCKDMLDKIMMVQNCNDGGGVILATGTPITNSITDIYIMQRYLQSAELKLLGLGSFDSWVAMFAQKSSNFEIDVDTSKYRMATRFSKFHNIPELTTILAAVADFHQMDITSGIPFHDGYEDALIPKTVEFSAYLAKISERADKVRTGRISRKKDNMLLITTDGRKAALDMRLADPKAKFTVASKVFGCAENVTRIYRDNSDKMSTQLVFCDTSTPKAGFNIYDELKGLLVKMGIPMEEIAYIHEATTEKKKEKLFLDMRNGVIRVLIGSTFKLGLGVNVQDRLLALHHLDVPWRPADMTQREGRILRQGNMNSRVHIYRYITEGSFDAYSWQLLETKQRFITAILSGSIAERSGSDIDDTVLSYAEVKALAVGNPLIKERVEVANELSRLSVLQQNRVTKMEGYQKDIPSLKEERRRLRDILVTTACDAEYYERHKRKYSPDERKILRSLIMDVINEELPREKETVLSEYQGFELIAPEKSCRMNRVFYLKREGKYMAKLSLSEQGSLIVIDNVLEGLCERVRSLKSRIDGMSDTITYMEEELKKRDEDYTWQIEKCRKRLEAIDKKLKVNDDEK